MTDGLTGFDNDLHEVLSPRSILGWGVQRQDGARLPGHGMYYLRNLTGQAPGTQARRRYSAAASWTNSIPSFWNTFGRSSDFAYEISPAPTPSAPVSCARAFAREMRDLQARLSAPGHAPGANADGIFGKAAAA